MGRAKATKETATAAEIIVKVAKIVDEYKNFVNFKDEVNKAVYNTYHKDFEECKRKVAQAFYLPNLNDIRANEFEGAEDEGSTRD